MPFWDVVRLLITWTTTVSPQSAISVGPGMEPLTAIAERETPSGDTVTSVSSSQYSRVTPVSGASILLVSRRSAA